MVLMLVQLKLLLRYWWYWWCRNAVGTSGGTSSFGSTHCIGGTGGAYIDSDATGSNYSNKHKKLVTMAVVELEQMVI